MAGILVVGGVVLDHVGVGAAPTTTTSTNPTSTTPSSVSTTTTIAGTAGVVSTPPIGGRTPSHCPLTLAAPAVHSSVRLNLAPRRCTILEVGDSLGNDLGWGLARQLSGYPWLTLVQKDKSSSGLVNAWFYSWPAHLATYLHHYHPNVVIVFLGGNDEQNVKINGVIENVGTPAWKATYTHYVQQVVNVARGAGVQVMWVGLPVMQPTYYSQGAAMLNSIYRDVIRHSPGTAYVPTWRLFATASGAFMAQAPVNGVNQQLRSSDGIHFSGVGENVVSTYVVSQLGDLFHLPLRAAESAVITRSN
jgi:hypothetical protein